MSVEKSDKSDRKGESLSENEEKSNLKGDYGNMALLVAIYFLQGTISGLTSAIPILLQNRGVSYKQQALFSASHYPFSLKVLWSPIVDSLYFRKIGRRKSWMIPFEILMGTTLIASSFHVYEWLGDGSGNEPQVVILTVIFFLLRMFAATHDVAADGWAITLLQKRNIGHVATAEAVGAVGGLYIGYVVLLIFESKDFCNSYIFSTPREEGLISLNGYMMFWGIIFLVAAFLIAFKKENSEIDKKLQEHPDFGVRKAYPTLLQILKLKPIIRLSIFLLTVKATFGAVDSVTLLKLVDYGVPKDKIALLAIPFLPIQIILSFIISRFTAGRFPMAFYMRAYQLRLFLSILMFSYVFMTPWMIGDKQSIPTYYYVGISIIYLLYQFPFRSMFVADTAFYARISDPLIGGTYMTLLNTIGNIGTKWPQTFFLYLVDVISWKRCIFDENNFTTSTSSSTFDNFTTLYLSNNFTLIDNKCENKEAKTLCIKNGGYCHTDIDGYYIEGAISIIYGIIFYKFGKKLVDYLERLPRSDFHILSKKFYNNPETDHLNEESKL